MLEDSIKVESPINRVTSSPAMASWQSESALSSSSGKLKRWYMFVSVFVFMAWYDLIALILGIYGTIWSVFVRQGKKLMWGFCQLRHSHLDSPITLSSQKPTSCKTRFFASFATDKYNNTLRQRWYSKFPKKYPSPPIILSFQKPTSHKTKILISLATKN